MICLSLRDVEDFIKIWFWDDLIHKSEPDLMSKKQEDGQSKYSPLEWLHRERWRSKNQARMIQEGGKGERRRNYLFEPRLAVLSSRDAGLRHSCLPME